MDWPAPRFGVRLFNLRKPLLAAYVAMHGLDLLETWRWWTYEANPLVLRYGLSFMVVGATAVGLAVFGFSYRAKLNGTRALFGLLMCTVAGASAFFSLTNFVLIIHAELM